MKNNKTENAETPALPQAAVMPRFLPSEFFDLEKYIILNNEIEMVFQIPSNMNIDFIGNKDNLLKMFKDVKITWTTGTPFQFVRCFKK